MAQLLIEIDSLPAIDTEMHSTTVAFDESHLYMGDIHRHLIYHDYAVHCYVMDRLFALRVSVSVRVQTVNDIENCL